MEKKVPRGDHTPKEAAVVICIGELACDCLRAAVIIQPTTTASWPSPHLPKCDDATAARAEAHDDGKCDDA